MSVSIKLRQRGARTEKEYTDELEQHGRDCGGHIAGLCWRWRWWTRWFHHGVGCRLHGCPLLLRHYSQPFLRNKTSVNSSALPPYTRTSKQILIGRCITGMCKCRCTQRTAPVLSTLETEEAPLRSLHSVSSLPEHGGRTDARRATCGAHRYAAAATCAQVTLQPQAATAAMARGRYRAAGGGRGFEDAVA